MSQPRGRFLRLQHVARIGVAVLGFSALWLGGMLPPLGVAAALAALVVGHVPRRPSLPASLWLVLQLGFVAWLLWSWVLAGMHVLTVFANLLVFVQVHRLLTRDSAQDDQYICFIAFGQLLLGSVLTVHASFLVIFLCFLACAPWVLLLSRLGLAVERDWALRCPGRPVDPREWEGLAPLARWPWLAAVSMLAVLLLGATIVLFFTLPRLQAGFLSASLLPPVHVSGFSDRVRLGEIGLVQLTNEPVMRVRLFDAEGQQQRGEDRYWHGVALDRFDGRAWSLSERRTTGLAWAGGRESRGPPRQRAWTLRQEVSLEPLDSPVVFHVRPAVGLYGSFRGLEAVETEGYYRSGGRQRADYTVYSNPVQPSSDELRAQAPAQVPEILLEQYTQLPGDLDPRLRELAADWTRGAATPVDAALLVQQELRGSFVYSLEQPASLAPDPLAAFLLDIREGHCEYFASSMVVLLRTLGIPSRIVNGFHGGEWNEVGQYTLVRQHHAHSWVEVYFPNAGWVLFEPTPAAAGGLSGRARVRFLARLGAWSDYAQVRWSDLLLNFGLDDQVEGLEVLAGWLAGSGEAPSIRSWLLGGAAASKTEREAAQAPGLWASGLLRSGLVLLLGVVALVLLSRWRAGKGSVVPRELRRLQRLVGRLERRWLRAEGVGGRKGRGDGRAMTLLILARRAAERDAALSAAPEAIELYYAARFGGEPAARGLQAELRQLLRLSRRRRARRAPRSAVRH